MKIQTRLQPKPTIDILEQRRGVVGWESVITPNQTLKFSVNYGVVYPKEGMVSGLP